MEIKQRFELRRLLVPELNQSLKILSLPLMDLKALIDSELLNNPFLEEQEKPRLSPIRNGIAQPDLDFRLSLISKKETLQDILLRQLGMFAETDQEYRIGQEIIGNIDENGYFKATLEEIAATLGATLDKAEHALKLIQQFEPVGVAARNVSECLLIQMNLAGEIDPLLIKIVENYLEDVAKKNYGLIAKALKEPQDKIELAAKKIIKLDPKPGRNYSAEEIQNVIPDIIIDEHDDEIEIAINDEDMPTVNINKDYKNMLKNNNLDPATKEFLSAKLATALALLRAVSKRKFTLRKIVEAITEIQQDAIKSDLSHLKPLTFQEVAQKIGMHESTVCRAIMNKYAKLPFGVVALKDFFSSHLNDKNGQSQSSNYAKRLIKESVDKEDKKRPLSDEDIAKILNTENNLNICRRTVAKYREELKILSSTFRRER
ncbi:MAG: RNA polymerase sigma-54 factor [Omnitrophica WOR_2 bacterium RBG_13_41_10]|nr:MAG: RNA polymerase sigma-54 factor [Omnitrophica WOR_2 bacterium RBG_13_41_10]